MPNPPPPPLRPPISSYSDRVTPLLDATPPVPALIYAGANDFICNAFGNERWLDVLPWSGHYDFEDAEFVEWRVGGRAAGAVKGDGLALTFVRVDGAVRAGRGGRGGRVGVAQA